MQSAKEIAEPMIEELEREAERFLTQALNGHHNPASRAGMVTIAASKLEAALQLRAIAVRTELEAQ